MSTSPSSREGGYRGRLYLDNTTEVCTNWSTQARDTPSSFLPPIHPRAMMVTPLRIFATLLLAAVGVSAQAESCIDTCLQGATSSKTCSIITNTTCVCTNTVYQAAVTACLAGNCTTADQKAAEIQQRSKCESSPANSSSSSTSNSSTITAPKISSGTIHDQVPFLNAAFALATIALGATFVL